MSQAKDITTEVTIAIRHALMMEINKATVFPIGGYVGKNNAATLNQDEPILNRKMLFEDAKRTFELEPINSLLDKEHKNLNSFKFFDSNLLT